eukprot:1377635-Lingulodinium_polyedra.AAC.1
MFNAAYWRLSWAHVLGAATPTAFHADSSLAFQGPRMDAFSCKMADLMVQVQAMDMLLRAAVSEA